ncbi:peritrophin-1-like [Anoplophora glabripennis]|uniref:peritrophin-1-like n=1 Tax=Anoplophora glabripennis TaxID=217634 RepID=UPI00087543C4|nr:peritrophin-1-like [Anoplophora glabripennis]
MQKLIIIFVFAIFAYALAVDCPAEDGEIPVYYPHETECGKFYECHNGEAALLDCAPGSYWDSRQNTCSSEVNCGDLLTSTAPPPTTESDRRTTDSE